MQDALQNSEDWIEREKKYGKLSAQEAIEAWNRVLVNQKNNIEAVKAANEGLFDSYKDLIKEQQDLVEEAFNDRIDQIDKEAEKQKDAQQAIIDGIEEQEKALSRTEDTQDYNNEMTELQKELAYWSVRTSKEAKEKVADINKQISEKEHDRDIELQKQGLEDKKEAAQKEIDIIEQKANDEKEALKKSWEGVQKLFDDNNTNMIASALSTGKLMWESFDKEFFQKLKEGFANSDIIKSKDEYSIPDVNNTIGDFNNTINSTHDWKMSDADYQKFISNGNRYKELSAQGQKESANVLMQKLRAENDAIRANYGRNPALGEYPKFHTGAKTLSYGIAEFKPGELVFPPNLSEKLESLIAVLGNSKTSDLRGTIFNGPLFHADKVLLEDKLDVETVGRELYRAIASM